MPRTKTPAPKPTTTRDHRVRLDLDAAESLALRIKAAKEELPMSQLVRRVVLDYLKNNP